MKSAKRKRRLSRNLTLQTLESRCLLTAAPNPFDLSTLDGANGFRVDGAEHYAGAGNIHNAGDVNGDGYDDVIIGAASSPGPNGDLGAAYVVFGKSGGFPSDMSVNDLDGINGFTIRNVSDGRAMTVGDSGDINGDGYDDLILGDWEYNDWTGAAYVVFGGTQFPVLLDLATLDGANGFRINGEAENDRAGLHVDNAGDFNGDGYDDIIIGLDQYGVTSDTPYSAYLVFGKSSSFEASWNLSSLDGTNGFAIEDAFESSRWGHGVGDINGDGFDDVFLGGIDEIAGAYVLYGTDAGESPSLHLDDINGGNGFRIRGALDGWFEGSGAGDFNGDGLDDFVLANPVPDDVSQGEVFVVFGRDTGFPAEFDVASLDGTNGFRVVGEERGTYTQQRLGKSVSTAGDTNGDGYDDLIVGMAPLSAADTVYSYVLFGRPAGFPATIEVASLDGSNGFRIESPPRFGNPFGDRAGVHVSGGGDVNGDGFADLLIGAPSAWTPPVGATGSSYVVFGSDYGGFTPEVTAEIVDGKLEIVGDDTANHIRVTSRLLSSVLIEGLDGTTINGQSEVTFEVSTYPFDINITMGKGADSVIVLPAGGTFIQTPVTIDMGPGNDFVELSRVYRGNFDIRTGGGDDHVLIQGETGQAIGARLNVDTGNGDDRVRIDAYNVLTTSEDGIELGKGNDVMEVYITDVNPYEQSATYFDGGPGHDRLFRAGGHFYPENFVSLEESYYNSDGFVGGDVTTEIVVDPNVGNILVVKGKDLFDHDLKLSSASLGQVTLESFGYGATIGGVAAPAMFTNINRVRIVLGSGTDTVFADGLLLSNNLIVKTGLGNDNVQIVGSQLNALNIDTGGGSDSVRLETTTVNRKTTISTGWGEDDVTILDSIFSRKVLLDGGLDQDTLHLLGVNLFNRGIDEDLEL